MSTTFL